MKRLIATVLCALFLGGCGLPARGEQYTQTFLDLFDTVTTVTAFCESREAFDALCAEVYGVLWDYHRLCDIYHDYDFPNLKTVNDLAGIRAVEVDERLLRLLSFAKEAAQQTEGSVNIALGPVLSLWHDCRAAAQENPLSAQLPSEEALRSAAENTDIEALELTDRTAFLTRRKMRLDVGAVAKGYAAARAAELLQKKGISGALNLGGTVVTVGTTAGGAPWRVGIQNPDLEAENDTLLTLSLSGQSLVTSGDYQRYMTVGGKRYAHIIDPETLFPPESFSSVSVLCSDAGWGDVLSTALFVLPLEKGQALVEKTDGVEAMWVKKDGEEIFSSGFEAYRSDRQWKNE